MFEKVKTFVKDSYQEMMEHVTWLSFSELQESSVLVLVASLVFALLVGVIDVAFRNAMDLFYGSF
ncbi:preprotein translocase subunit SecE [Rapidithrix thailandica]|uniref:Protein translocase subunit SecE n=1 Tax=Rapidithrix thailandica TaxID=413964 RepID=A0AAW9S716_9BACT